MKNIFTIIKKIRRPHIAAALTITALSGAWTVLAQERKPVEDKPATARAILQNPRILQAPIGDKPVLIKPGALQPLRPQWNFYALETPRVNGDEFQKIIQRTLPGGMQGKMAQGEEELTFADPKDPSAFFMQDKATGNLSYTGSMAKYFGDTKPDLPDPRKAEDLAISYLKETNLMPANPADLRLIHVGGMRMSESKDGKNGPVVDKSRTLTYGRLLNGQKVLGTGSKIVVHIGDRGEVIGLDRKWREVGKAQAIPATEVKSQREAQAEITRFLANEWGKEAKVSLKEVSVNYYDGDGGFIQPAYFFKATIQTVDGSAPYFGAIPLMRKPPEAIGPAAISAEARRLIQKSPREAKPPGRELLD